MCNFVPVSQLLEEPVATTSRLKAFSSKADRLIENDPVAGFRACQTLLANACRDGLFTDILNQELKRLLLNPDYVPENSTDLEMLLWRSPNFALVLKNMHMPGGQNRVFGLPEDHIIAPVCSQGVRFSRYFQPKPEPNDVFDRSRHLEYKGEESLSVGESAYFKAGQDVFLIYSDTEEPPVVAFFASPMKLSLRWEYNPRTLAPVRAVAADTGASRLEFLAGMMASLGSTNSVQALIRLLEHPAHFVRWAALQAIYRLDRQKGVELLHKAVDDSHEHVRNAAQRSLARLTGEDRPQMNAAPPVG